MADTVKYAELAQQLIPEEDVYRRAQAVIMLEFTHWANGDLEAARRALDGWMNAMRQIGNVVFVIATAFGVADIQVAQGRLREALRTYEGSLQSAAEAGPDAEAITAHHHLGLALLHHEMEDAEGFTRHWQQAEALGRRTTLVDWPYRWHAAQARVKASEGDFDAALELLDEAKRVYAKNPVPDLRPVEALKAQVYLRQGHLSKAQAWTRARGVTVHDDLRYLREFEHLTLARILMATGQNRQAGELLERLRQAAEAQDRMGSVLEILLAQALAYRSQGDATAAFAALERGLTLAEPEGYVRTFVDEGETIRLLIADFRALIEKQGRREGQQLIGYVDRLLAAFGKVNRRRSSFSLHTCTSRRRKCPSAFDRAVESARAGSAATDQPGPLEPGDRRSAVPGVEHRQGLHPHPLRKAPGPAAHRGRGARSRAGPALLITSQEVIFGSET